MGKLTVYQMVRLDDHRARVATLEKLHKKSMDRLRWRHAEEMTQLRQQLTDQFTAEKKQLTALLKDWLVITQLFEEGIKFDVADRTDDLLERMEK